MHPPTSSREPDEPDGPDVDELDDEPPFSDLFRDFVAFEVKLFLDGLKDIVLAQGAVVALVLGLLRRRRRALPFHRLLHLGDRFERWLGLYRPISEDADDVPFGGANRALREAERRIRTRRGERDAAEDE